MLAMAIINCSYS